MDDRPRHVPAGVLVVSVDGIMNGINEVTQLRISAAGDVVDAPLAEMFPRSVKDSLLLAFGGNSVTKTSLEKYYPELEHWLGVSVASTDNGVAIYVEDVTERRHHGQSIEKLRIKHKRTAIIETMFPGVLVELVGITSRAGIAETTCRSLRETDIHEFAWVGKREVGSGSPVLRAATGDTGGTAAVVRGMLDDRTVMTLEERVVETGRLQAA